MDIRFLRIDSRLIHGQITTNWIRALKINRIIVVSDSAARDELRKALMMQTVPEHIKVNVISVDKMIRLMTDERFSKFQPMVIVENVHDARRLIENGLDVKKVNIGSLSFSAGKQMVTDSIAVDPQDVDDLTWIHQQKIKLEAQKVSTDTAKDLWSILIDKKLVTA